MALDFSNHLTLFRNELDQLDALITKENKYTSELYVNLNKYMDENKNLKNDLNLSYENTTSLELEIDDLDVTLQYLIKEYNYSKSKEQQINNEIDNIRNKLIKLVDKFVNRSEIFRREYNNEIIEQRKLRKIEEEKEMSSNKTNYLNDKNQLENEIILIKNDLNNENKDIHKFQIINDDLKKHVSIYANERVNLITELNSFQKLAEKNGTVALNSKINQIKDSIKETHYYISAREHVYKQNKKENDMLRKELEFYKNQLKNLEKNKEIHTQMMNKAAVPVPVPVSVPVTGLSRPSTNVMPRRQEYEFHGNNQMTNDTSSSLNYVTTFSYINDNQRSYNKYESINAITKAINKNKQKK